MKGFEAQASNAVLDFTGDDDSQMRKKKNLMRWDVKKKKYVKAEQVKLIVLSHILISEINCFLRLSSNISLWNFYHIQDDQKKIKTESGVWIPASYKSDRYKKWKQRSRLSHMQENNTLDGDALGNDNEGKYHAWVYSNR